MYLALIIDKEIISVYYSTSFAIQLPDLLTYSKLHQVMIKSTQLGIENNKYSPSELAELIDHTLASILSNHLSKDIVLILRNNTVNMHTETHYHYSLHCCTRSLVCVIGNLNLRW